MDEDEKKSSAQHNDQTATGIDALGNALTPY